MAYLNEEEHKKISDLRRIYGTNGVGELIGVERSLIEVALTKEETAQDLRQVKSGIKRYWKTWMSRKG